MLLKEQTKSTNVLNTNVQKKEELNRRDFMKLSANTGLAAVAATMTTPYVLNATSMSMDTGTKNSKSEIKYSACLVNCGSRCPLKVHVVDGIIRNISTETMFDDSEYDTHQIRPCLRGRSVKWKTYSPDRLKYPMKRVGKRGEGKFERITWDEATTIIAEKLKYTVETYGNEAVYYQYGSGSTGANLQGRNAGKRLLNTYGGFLEQYGTYSSAQINGITPYIYGGTINTLMTEIKNSDLVVMFGQNVAVTRMSGGGQFYETLTALKQSNAKVIIIDPVRTDSVVTMNAEWIPIKPGTDGALVAALIHTMIKENLTDEDFLKEYCIGWDETTLPENAPINSSYKDYILGTGDDVTEKTPKWAEKITGIPANRIIQLAREIGNAKAAWISQGYGPQRTSNGEQASRAIMMLPIVSGNIGKPGTNAGHWGGSVTYPVQGFAIPNPVKTTISFFTWTDAIKRGTEMTKNNSHLRNKEKLDVNIKFLWNYASNVTMNQHSDLNKTTEILQDESLCEFIVVWDTHMTATAKFADVLLPDVSSVESNDLINNSYASGSYSYCIRMQETIKPMWECRQSYDVMSEIAHKLGIGEKYTEGRTHAQWIEYCYNKMREKNPNLPTFEETNDMGIVDRKIADSSKSIALKAFREDRVANPLKTPSGKIEIYSERLAKLATESEILPGDKIPATPEYCPTTEGVENTEMQKKYPLQMIGIHVKGHVHSSYFSIAMLREAFPHLLWINPLDANARNIKENDTVEVFNDRGRISVKVKITNRIHPGVIALPQGAWRNVDNKGVDIGGCINTLTSMRPSPIVKGNPQHTNLVEVKLA
ncbi:MAG: DMSO/selenate family reductase complex A subunit [Campylobacteraceae bacterium]